MTGIILAGGKSSRMGKDKSILPWDTSDMLNTIADKLGKICDELIVVSNTPRIINRDGVRVVTDIMPGIGSLGGIHAGLTYSTSQYAFITACDMPYLVQEAVEYLFREAQGWDIAIPGEEDFFEPLFACYSKNCLPTIESFIAKDIRKITAFIKLMNYKAINREVFRQFDPDLKLFTNINTMEEYKQAAGK